MHELILNVLRSRLPSEVEGLTPGEAFGDALSEVLGRDGSAASAICALEISGAMCRAAQAIWEDEHLMWGLCENDDFGPAVLRWMSDVASVHGMMDVANAAGPVTDAGVAS